MFDSIIFLTDRYPYEQGESFIGNEIVYLKAACKKLYIVPINARDYNRSRVLEDEDIVVWKGNHSISKLSKITKVPYLLFDYNIRAEITNLIRNHNFNRETLSFLLYFAVQFNNEADEIVQWLSDKIKSDSKVLVYSYWLYNTAYVGCKLKEKLSSIKYVISRAHGFDLYLERNKNNYLPLRKYIIDNLDAIYPISENGREYLTKLYPFKKQIKTQRLGTADYGVNPGNFSNKSYVIVSCSNIIPVKRCKLIVDILSKMDIDVLWIHFGDGVERRELIEYAQRNLPSNIKYCIDGAIDNSQLMNFYKKNHIDAFINVSESEGVPVSIMEALSFGVPVLATNVGGTSEVVVDGRNGYLLKCDFNPDEGVALLKKILMNKSGDLRRMARFSWESSCSAIHNYSAFFELLDKEIKYI